MLLKKIKIKNNQIQINQINQIKSTKQIQIQIKFKFKSIKFKFQFKSNSNQIKHLIHELPTFLFLVLFYNFFFQIWMKVSQDHA